MTKEIDRSTRIPYLGLKIVLAVLGIIIQVLSYLLVFAVVGHYGARGVFLAVIFLPVLLIAVDILFIYSIVTGDKLEPVLKIIANIIFAVFSISIFGFFLYFLSHL